MKNMEIIEGFLEKYFGDDTKDIVKKVLKSFGITKEDYSDFKSDKFSFKKIAPKQDKNKKRQKIFEIQPKGKESIPEQNKEEK